MKKHIVAVVLFLLVAVPAGADNSARIKELMDEGQQMINRREQALAVTKQCEDRIAEIRGAIKELQVLDAPKPKEAAPIVPEQKPKITP